MLRNSLDQSFAPLLAGMSNVLITVLQPDERILVASNEKIARVNPDGSVDPTFNPALIGPIQQLVLQPDGKLLVGGAGPIICGEGGLHFDTNTDRPDQRLYRVIRSGP